MYVFACVFLTSGQFCLFPVCGVFLSCSVFVLSVPVQVIAWKVSSPEWPIICRAGCQKSSRSLANSWWALYSLLLLLLF